MSFSSKPSSAPAGAAPSRWKQAAPAVPGRRQRRPLARLAGAGATLLLLGVLLAACGGGATPASAKHKAATPSTSYPTQPITIVVPVTAGSSDDIEARELAEYLGPILGQSVVVLDDAGSSGAIGLADVMSKPADGYTLFYEDPGSISDLIVQKLIPYSASSIEEAVQIDGEAPALITAANSPYKTLKQIVTYAKAHPNALSVGATGTVGWNHEVYLALEKDAGIKLKYIPTDGGAETGTDTESGITNFGIVTPSAYYPLQEAGKLRTVAVAYDGKKYPPLPNLPTFISSGYNIAGYNYRGIWVRSGTPTAIVDKLEAATAKVFASKQWKAYMKKELQLPNFLGTAAAAAQFKTTLKEFKKFDKGYLASIAASGS